MVQPLMDSIITLLVGPRFATSATRLVLRVIYFILITPRTVEFNIITHYDYLCRVTQYTAYLEQGVNVDLAAFMAWPDKQDGGLPCLSVHQYRNPYVLIGWYQSRSQD